MLLLLCLGGFPSLFALSAFASPLHRRVPFRLFGWSSSSGARRGSETASGRRVVCRGCIAPCAGHRLVPRIIFRLEVLAQRVGLVVGFLGLVPGRQKPGVPPAPRPICENSGAEAASAAPGRGAKARVFANRRLRAGRRRGCGEGLCHCLLARLLSRALLREGHAFSCPKCSRRCSSASARSRARPIRRASTRASIS